MYNTFIVSHFTKCSFFYPGGVPTNSIPLDVGLLSSLLVFFLLILATAAVITFGIGIWLHLHRKRKSFRATTGKCA